MFHEKFIRQVEQHALKYNMFDGCDVIIAGLSGGADSVCLVKVLKELSAKYGFFIEAVHVHHGIRGEEADRDFEFAKKFCEDNSVLFNGIKVDIPGMAKALGIGEEEAGRKARYEIFNNRAGEYETIGKNTKIAVAHNMNDSGETMLFNLFRGSGIDGLTGIRPVNGNIIRPLLSAAREEIEEYLGCMGIDYCTDSTNLMDTYARNIIRHKILPVAGQINAGAVKHMAAAMSELTGARDFIDICGNNAYDRIVCVNKDGEGNVSCVHASAKEILSQHPFIIRWIIRRMVESAAGKLKDVEEAHIRICEDILRGATGRKASIAYGIIVCKSYDDFEIYRHQDCTGQTNQENNNDSNAVNGIIYMEEEDTQKKLYSNEGFQVRVPGGCFRMWINESNIFIHGKNNYTKMFDYDKIKCDFFVRKRQQGDYIVISEKGTSKKLNRFFIDNKVPVKVRESIYMLCAGNEVLFIPGYRSSEGYRISGDTRRTLKVTFFPDTKDDSLE